MSGEAFMPEMGQAVFGNPAGEFSCPEFVTAGLDYLATEIERVEWNRTQRSYDAPTGNNGGEYIFPGVFEMRAYYWGGGPIAELPNFKCGDLEVRWYKYLGRGMSLNRAIDANEFFALIDKCLIELRNRERAEDESDRA